MRVVRVIREEEQKKSSPPPSGKVIGTPPPPPKSKKAVEPITTNEPPPPPKKQVGPPKRFPPPPPNSPEDKRRKALAKYTADQREREKKGLNRNPFGDSLMREIDDMLSESGVSNTRVECPFCDNKFQIPSYLDTKLHCPRCKKEVTNPNAVPKPGTPDDPNFWNGWDGPRDFIGKL